MEGDALPCEEGSGCEVTIDVSKPVVTASTIGSDNVVQETPYRTKANEGDVIKLDFITNEDIVKPVVMLAGTGANVATGVDNCIENTTLKNQNTTISLCSGT